VKALSARLVAAGVVLMSAPTLVTQEPLIIVLPGFGFVAHALAGPRFSTLGQLVTRVITPKFLEQPKYTASPPKPFARSTGADVSKVTLMYAPG